MRLLNKLAPQLPPDLVNALQEESIAPDLRRQQIEQLRGLLSAINDTDANVLASEADHFVDKSIWLIGGDGWAYDIGYGGLDHVMSLSENVNVLVLDTQCYSNTGGQQSKATPLGAVTKFGEKGKRKARKDLGINVMMYGHVYVAQISLGAQLNQTVKAIQEAETGGSVSDYRVQPVRRARLRSGIQPRSDAPIDGNGLLAALPLRPTSCRRRKAALVTDSRPPSSSLSETLLKEQRFRRLNSMMPEETAQLYEEAELDLRRRFDFLTMMAGKAEKNPQE